MSKLAIIVTLTGLIAANAALAQTAVPDLRGTWKGESQTIILGAGNPHHAAPPATAPRLSSVAFTLTIDKQDGRRFSGTFSSSSGNETVIAVISQSGTIYMVDDDGYIAATMLAPNRLELCYLLQSSASRIASCTEFTKSLSTRVRSDFCRSLLGVSQLPCEQSSRGNLRRRTDCPPRRVSTTLSQEHEVWVKWKVPRSAMI